MKTKMKTSSFIIIMVLATMPLALLNTLMTTRKKGISV